MFLNLNDLQLIYDAFLNLNRRLRGLQIRLLTGRSKSRQRGGRGTSLESTSSSRLEPRQSWEVDTAGLAPHTSVLLSDSHASCYAYLLVVLRRATIVIPQHEGGVPQLL